MDKSISIHWIVIIWGLPQYGCYGTMYLILLHICMVNLVIGMDKSISIHWIIIIWGLPQYGCHGTMYLILLHKYTVNFCNLNG